MAAVKSSPARGIALGLAALSAVAVLLALVHQCRQHYPSLNEGGDWSVYYRAGEAMAQRRPIYTLERGPLLTFKNAPVVALLIAPLSAAPPFVARFIWFFGDLSLLAWIFILCRQLLPARDRSDAPGGFTSWIWVALGAWLLTERFIMYQLGAGTNATLYIALSLAACCWMVRGRPVAAGTALAGAVFLKVVPICLLPYLLLRRGRARAIGSFSAATLALALLPAVWIGWNANRDLLIQWPRHLRETDTPAQNARPTNQSVNALLARLFGPKLADRPNAPPSAIKRYRPHIYLGTGTIQALWMILSLTAAAALYGLIWRTRLPAGPDAETSAGVTDAMHLSLLLIYLTLFNPLAWRYNFVALIVPYYFVLHVLSQGSVVRPKLLWMTGLAYALNALPMDVRGLPWLDLFQVYGSHTWGTLLLAATVITAWHGYRIATCGSTAILKNSHRSD
jgi:hypothetical protein